MPAQTRAMAAFRVTGFGSPAAKATQIVRPEDELQVGAERLLSSEQAADPRPRRSRPTCNEAPATKMARILRPVSRPQTGAERQQVVERRSPRFRPTCNQVPLVNTARISGPANTLQASTERLPADEQVMELRPLRNRPTVPFANMARSSRRASELQAGTERLLACGELADLRPRRSRLTRIAQPIDELPDSAEVLLSDEESSEPPPRRRFPMDNPEEDEEQALLAVPSAATFARTCTGTAQGGLHLVLADGPNNYSGLLVEYLGGTVMIFADCGDRTYEWLPRHEVAGSDAEDGLVARRRFPELGSLLCCGLSVALLVMAGCKRRRAEQRPRAGHATWCKIARSLQKFRALWARTDSPTCEGANRRLRLRRPENPIREEAPEAEDGTDTLQRGVLLPCAEA